MDDFRWQQFPMKIEMTRAFKFNKKCFITAIRYRLTWQLEFMQSTMNIHHEIQANSFEMIHTFRHTSGQT